MVPEEPVQPPDMFGGKIFDLLEVDKRRVVETEDAIGAQTVERASEPTCN